MLEAKNVWMRALSVLKDRISHTHYKTWFKNTNFKIIEDGVCQIGVGSAYAKEVIIKHYFSVITEVVSEILGKKTEIKLVVESSLFKPQKPEDSSEPLFTQLPQTIITSNTSVLREDFTFDNFAVSTSNQLAHAASVAASKMPGRAYNPLFIYGGVGVGKSHLMHAVGHAILSNKPGAKIVYCTGEEFTNELISSFSTKTTGLFKRKFREVDCLLIDDIQFIAGKVAIQEEFFHTFNALQRLRSQIILTSDKPPSEIARMEERLVSRFEAGMIVDIQSPDFELRTAILLIKAKNLEINLPMACAQVIAENAADIRKMEGILTRLTVIATIQQTPITIDLVNQFFQTDPKNNTIQKIIQPKLVIEATATHYGLKVSQLKGSKRNRVIARPRQVVMYLLKQDLNLPLVEIGRFLGGRDHTTVLHGVGKIENLLLIDNSLNVDIAGIRKQIWG